jgi:hypothetical protein
MNITWYIKRLTAMSPTEVLSRIGFWAKKNSWRNAAKKSTVFRDCTPIRQFNKADFTICKIDCSSEQAQALLAEADKYLSHIWNFFGLHDVAEPVIDWHFDPLTKLNSPQKYSFDINHRNSTLIGDAKIHWEKSRHHHITVLCAAFVLTKNEKYALEATTQLVDWIEKNSCLIGINWTHPLELGIRLISWTWCERLLRKSIHYDKAFGPQSPVWLSIGQHQEVIAETYSGGSSANNHLIGEMAGLFIASVAFPIYKKSSIWRSLSQGILETEIAKQTFPSGVNKEMAFEYQIFVAEFLLLSLHEANNAKINFSENFKAILKKSLEVIVQLTDYGKLMPRYGDGDDGMALQLQARGQSRATWILQHGSILLDSDMGDCEETALPLLLMGYDRDFKSAKPAVIDENVSYADAGVYVLSNNRNTPMETFVVADAGPLGYLSLAAHGHADALSFTLSGCGKELFTDPGTYNYYTDELWRNYFRSTQCHNTVVLDNLDQSKLQGKFLWSHKANTFVTEWRTDKKGATLGAWHDGYKKTIGCIHKRVFNLSNNILTIEDTLSGKKDHLVRLCFHCPPQCILQQESKNRLRIINGSVSALLTLPQILEVTLHKGEQFAGWFSPSFGVKDPSCTIFAQARCTLPIVLTTVIEVIHES